MGGGSDAGAECAVDGAPVAGDVGMFAGEVESGVDGVGHFFGGIGGVCGDVAVGTLSEGIFSPVVGGVGEEFPLQRGDREAKSALQIAQGDGEDRVLGE